MKRPACVVGCCLLVFLALFFYLKPPEPESMASISGKSIKIYGIADDKYQKNKNTYLLVREAGIVSGKESNKKYKVTVKLKESLKNLSEAPKIGALVTVSGKVTEFSRARNPGNFDYAKYQIIRGIDFEIYGADAAEIPEKGRIRYMDEALCLLRERLSETIDSIYKDEDAGEIKAILLGDRTELTDELKSGYRRAGMSHILCISSLHVTLIGMGLLGLIRKTGLNKTASSIIAFSLISMYGRLTGSGISTVRALITFGLMIAAEFAGRTPDLLSSMAEAAVVIMLAKPLYVLDAGFILSFSAVCGIGMLGSPLKRLIPSDSGVIGSFRTSLSVTLFMLPETLYFFYQISVFSVLINLAVIPLLSILLTFSVISVIAGELFVPLGALFGIPVKLILALYRQITRLNDGIPLSVITPGRPEIWQIVLYYAILAGLIVYTERKYKPDTLIRVLCTAFIVLGVSMLLIRMRPDISLTMVDVGQGDCHLIETGGGKTVMIDCGSRDVDNAAKYRVIPYVLSRGHDTLDYA
ncbi:MAG: ComEC/Rec2 family competence protein, partial [Lachnospiraceae bacterium]|nr:ComEC/Rec2 family competence protein [Lachnospiraceae bacterium]